MDTSSEQAGGDRVVPEQVEALWAIREQFEPALTPEEAQLLAALRAALARRADPSSPDSL